MIESLLIGLVWAGCGGLFLATALTSSRLVRAFVARHPDQATKLMPQALDGLRHPEVLLVFFDKEHLPVIRGDEVVWRLRQRFKWLALGSFLLPPAVLFVLALVVGSARLRGP